jgi:hypothetical protein
LKPEKNIRSRPENEKPENKRLNSRFTLIDPRMVIKADFLNGKLEMSILERKRKSKK